MLTSLNTIMSPSSPWPTLIPLDETQSHESLPHLWLNVYRLSLTQTLCRQSQLRWARECHSFFFILNLFIGYVRGCVYMGTSMPQCAVEVRWKFSKQFPPSVIKVPGTKFVSSGLAAITFAPEPSYWTMSPFFSREKSN